MRGLRAGCLVLIVVVVLTGAAAVAAALLPTSPAVRAAMTGVRNLVADNHSLITHRRMPRDKALRFHGDVAARLAAIAAEAGAQPPLAEIVAGLARGAMAIAGQPATQPATGLSAIEGIVLMDEMLQRYADLFDHPGWKGPRDL
ncbi:MAG: hypothetical protein NW217_10160 [Hyphomicrobiaceae bacterium]|nr:hypothetical protein [Hyphomicrobiaceae bacterium]